MWDQPNRRAVFSLTVTAPSDQMAVSNMPVASAARVSGGLTRTRFADTPSMPSYLLFLAVGDFERITRDVDGVELGVIVRRGANPPRRSTRCRRARNRCATSPSISASAIPCPSST